MIKKIFLSLLVLLPFVSCSDISEDERFIPIESVTPQRAVLLEDFTGQECVNCPAAHREIESLVKQYPEDIVPVSIHAGSFAISATARRPGLMQPEGNIYNDRYGIDEWPKGVVDGRSGALNPGQWSDYVREELKREAAVAIDLSASVSPDDPTVISIECTLRPAANLQGALQLWIIEDGIVAKQIDKEAGTIPDYVHNHVFRAVVNGIDGENVSLQAGVHKTIAHTIGIRDTEKEKWVAENLSVVAFIRQADGGVAQVARCKVML